MKETIAALLHISDDQAFRVIAKYSGQQLARVKAKNTTPHVESLSLPLGTGSLQAKHRDYLSSRQFHPDRVSCMWNLQGTGPIGPYRHRLIIPIYHADQLVSYTSRDVTNKSELRYKTCPTDQEIVSHKHMLYGWQYAINHSTVVIVEGPADAWRLGPGAVATFGITWTTEQAKLLRRFAKIYILYDFEDAAQDSAERLGMYLSVIHPSSDILLVSSTECHEKDPSDLSDEEAKELYGTPKLNYKTWTKECSKVLDKNGLLIVYHKYVMPNPDPELYTVEKRVFIGTRTYHLPRVAIFFRKRGNLCQTK